MFTNPIFRFYFGNGKIIPISRGSGINQLGMQIAIQKLKRGDWIHMFPEGKVNQSGKLLRLKWGVAHLIKEASIITFTSDPLSFSSKEKTQFSLCPSYSSTSFSLSVHTPIVLPIYIHGFEKIMPEGKLHIPRPFGKEIYILIGPPIQFGHLLVDYEQMQKPREALYTSIMAIIEKELKALEAYYCNSFS